MGFENQRLPLLTDRFMQMRDVVVRFRQAISAPNLPQIPFGIRAKAYFPAPNCYPNLFPFIKPIPNNSGVDTKFMWCDDKQRKNRCAGLNLTKNTAQCLIFRYEDSWQLRLPDAVGTYRALRNEEGTFYHKEAGSVGNHVVDMVPLEPNLRPVPVGFTRLGGELREQMEDQHGESIFIHARLQHFVVAGCRVVASLTDVQILKHAPPAATGFLGKILSYSQDLILQPPPPQ